MSLYRKGNYIKACSILTQKPPSVVTQSVVAEMKAKHPEPRHPIDWTSLRDVHFSAAASVDDDLVQKMISSFPRGSAGGPSGLKPQHMKDALQEGFRDELLRLLAQVINKLAQGDAPDSIRPFISGANLVAMPKDSGDNRPIAVGETLRRLVSKCLLDRVNDDARTRLEPVQVGVGTKAGAEAIVHAGRQWMQRHSTDTHRVLVKLDLSNAFNCVDRQALLNSVRTTFPELATWADFSYGGSSGLWMDGGTLGISTGRAAG